MKKKASRFFRAFLAVLLAFTCIPSGSLAVSVKAADTPVNTNLALNKTVTASAEYGSMPASNLTDDDKESRWSTEADATQWAYVDLGASYEMNYFSIIWESDSVYGGDYNIYVSDSADDWGEPVVSREGSTTAASEETLAEAVSGRYVKLEVTDVVGYPSVSARDFTIMLKDDSQPTPQDPEENVALGKTASSSSNETAELTADKAFDGDVSTKASRWSSNTGNAPHWLSVDLGEQRDVKTVRIFWETRKATAYEIQISDNGQDWTPVKTMKDRPASTTDTITLDETVQARYVRLYISTMTAEDPDGGVTWNTISVYEM